eukprot:3939117-Rhodomonas_salina.1
MGQTRLVVPISKVMYGGRCTLVPPSCRTAQYPDIPLAQYPLYRHMRTLGTTGTLYNSVPCISIHAHTRA